MFKYIVQPVFGWIDCAAGGCTALEATTKFAGAPLTAATFAIGGLEGVGIDAAAAGITKAGLKEAFEVAKAGGKHAGFLKNYVGRPATEIQKAMTSIEKQIADHESWIANPQLKIPHFESLDPRQQAALINSKWPSDIARQQEQLEILRGLLGGG